MSGMTFNGVNSSALHFEHCSARIPLLPERRPSTIEIPGRDGTVDFNNDSYLPRLIAVDCLIKASTEAELTSRLAAAAAWLSGSGTLVFDHDTTKRWSAKVYQGIEQTFIPLGAPFTVIFECQPYAEDVTETTGSIGVATDYGSAIKFYPTITVGLTAGTASLQVTLQSTGEYVRIDQALTSGDTIIINMATGKVTRNGSLIKINLASLFFAVPPGNQTITVTAGGTYTSNIKYRKRYLYA